MGLIWTLILGAAVGWLASVIMHRDAEQGWIANILVGVVGALVGSFIGGLFGQSAALALTLPGLLWSLAGAVVLCGVLNYFQHDRIR